MIFSSLGSRFAGSTSLSRRSITLLVVFGIFLGALLVASKRLGSLCPDGSYYCGEFASSRHEHTAQIKSQPEGSIESGVGKDNNHVNIPSATVHRDILSKPTGTLESDCAHFPDTSNILLIMKTGASEAYARIPTQLVTTLKCLPDFLIFSDMEQKVAGYKIHDSLQTVIGEVKFKNKDFDLYHRQQTCAVDQENCNKDTDSASAGWALDKYKNIHMAEKAFHMRPDFDWYLFVDADTYVVWSTMVEWLKKLDASNPMYFGSVAMLGDLPFGHGGSGYVVSKTAMHEFFEGKTNVANRWDQRTTRTCCGDAMFSEAIREETGIVVNNTVSLLW